MSDLLELAARCEAATGPDREIDRDIALAFDLYDQPEDLGCFPDEAEAVVGGGGQTWAPLEYTASLDAAMTLVPEGCGFEVGSAYGGDIIARGHTYALNGRFDARIYTPRDGSFDNEAATPALALCAAALRARAAVKSPEVVTKIDVRRVG